MIELNRRPRLLLQLLRDPPLLQLPPILRLVQLPGLQLVQLLKQQRHRRRLPAVQHRRVIQVGCMSRLFPKRSENRQ